MQTFIKCVLTAALVIAIAWPMAFWGTAASHDVRGLRNIFHGQQFTLVPERERVW
jgi:hypothetical protein